VQDVALQNAVFCLPLLSSESVFVCDSCQRAVCYCIFRSAKKSIEIKLPSPPTEDFFRNDGNFMEKFLKMQKAKGCLYAKTLHYLFIYHCHCMIIVLSLLNAS